MQGYLSSALQEYGIGAVTLAAPQTWAGVSSIDDQELQKALRMVKGDPNTVYIFFFPEGVHVTNGQQVLCQGEAGYHSAVPGSDGQPVLYAVVPSCGSVLGLQGFDTVTVGASHELIEAFTDPLSAMMQPGLAGLDDAHVALSLFYGGGQGQSEICDLCNIDASAGSYAKVGQYTVARAFSNASAAAFHDPCVPLPSGVPYFNTNLVLPDTVTLTGAGPGGSDLGPIPVLKLAAGQSRSIDVQFFSDAPTSGPWTIEPLDATAAFSMKPSQLQFSSDVTQGQDGDVAHVTMTLGSGNPGDAILFAILSRQGSRVQVSAGAVMVTP